MISYFLVLVICVTLKQLMQLTTYLLFFLYRLLHDLDQLEPQALQLVPESLPDALIMVIDLKGLGIIAISLVKLLIDFQNLI